MVTIARKLYTPMNCNFQKYVIRGKNNFFFVERDNKFDDDIVKMSIAQGWIFSEYNTNNPYLLYVNSVTVSQTDLSLTEDDHTFVSLLAAIPLYSKILLLLLHPADINANMFQINVPYWINYLTLNQ